MNDLVAQARKASAHPRDCRRTIDALQAMGFGEDAFRRLHHQSGSLARFCSYSKGVRQFERDGNNHRVHRRLMYVLLSCPDSTSPKGKNPQNLADEALRVIPPIQ
jgi:hypothetical protein